MPEILSTFSLFELFDILLTAVCIYFFIRILKRETAIRLLLLLLIFFAVYFISHFSGLASTSLVFDGIYSSALIILAIMFQADIRRAFLAFGRRYDLEEPSDESASDIEELIKALKELSDKSIGALIVVVRNIPIDHLVEVGTQIEAKVTSELLNSIFLPYSPIHDGAVIINQGKIVKAGCLLPLSRNPDISKNFGTRHRAALGLAEQTDALVLVVSEETGKISVVHEGKINYDVDAAEIRHMLKRSSDTRRPFKNVQVSP